MMNNRFRVKLGFGYNMLENGDNSLPFKSDYFRASLEGVVNLTSLLGFESWTKNIGLLAHGGIEYSVLKAKEPVDKGNDQMTHAIIGITPQIKLSNRIALTTDLSFLTHIRQHLTWDGTAGNPDLGVGGNLVNLSAGLTFYLGKHGTHADWVPETSMSDEIMEDFEARIAKIETDMIDT